MSNAFRPSHTNMSAKREDRGTPFQVLQQNFSHHQDYTTTDPRHHSKRDHDLSIRWHPPHYRTKMWDPESWSHHTDAPVSSRPYPTQEHSLLPKTLGTAQNCNATPSPTPSKRTMLEKDTENCTPSPPGKPRTTAHACNVVSPAGAELIWEPHPFDVVCGRGAPTNYTLGTAQNCNPTPSPTPSKRTMLEKDTENCTPSPPGKPRTTAHACNVVSPAGAELIWEPHPFDIVCDRGAPTNYTLPSPPKKPRTTAHACNVVSPAGAELIWELHTSDIVCGRGAPTNYHQGNEEFRYIVEDYQTSYLCAKRSDKPGVAFKLLEVVKSRGGRFLKRQKASGRQAWAEVGEKQAYEKVCQALRDGAPELRRQMMAASKKKELRENIFESENCSNIQNWR